MIKAYIDTEYLVPSEKKKLTSKKTVTHHSHLAVCHGWLNLLLGGCHGYDGGDFCCGAEVVLPHLTVK